MSNTISINHYKRLVGACKRKSKYGSTKKAWIEAFNGEGILRFYARSSYEMTFARFLEVWCRNDKTLTWKHEDIRVTFEGYRNGCICYVPDFTVYRHGELIQIYEIKGLLEGKDITKIKRLKKCHPLLFEKLCYVTQRKNYPRLVKQGVKYLMDIEEINRRLRCQSSFPSRSKRKQYNLRTTK